VPSSGVDYAFNCSREHTSRYIVAHSVALSRTCDDNGAVSSLIFLFECVEICARSKRYFVKQDSVQRVIDRVRRDNAIDQARHPLVERIRSNREGPENGADIAVGAGQ
jgi:hypothetical protein